MNTLICVAKCSLGRAVQQRIVGIKDEVPQRIAAAEALDKPPTRANPTDKSRIRHRAPAIARPD
ncbi:hypothetical protein [Coleofasciculus sp. H7-2]|uniref:hypothetical protein n=1 Tax=Coleofasciculus sp. H7-2 TaxID=3351545 RepID=UPI00366C0335